MAETGGAGSGRDSGGRGVRPRAPATGRAGLMQVVVVESPAKARTIRKVLGPGYRVHACYGHVRDLPAKAGSVRPDDDFAMVYETSSRRAARALGIRIVSGASRGIRARRCPQSRPEGGRGTGR